MIGLDGTQGFQSEATTGVSSDSPNDPSVSVAMISANVSRSMATLFGQRCPPRMFTGGSVGPISAEGGSPKSSLETFELTPLFFGGFDVFEG